MQIIIGIIVIIIGLYFVIKTSAIYTILGVNGFFERYLGAGNSRFGYKLVGVFFIFIGILFVTGMITGFANFIFGPLIRAQSIK